MTTAELFTNFSVDVGAKAPLPAATRTRLSSDAQNIKAAAHRKQLTLDHWEERRETEVAQTHFELGCWLHFYRGKIGLPNETGLRARVECAMHLFLNGVQSPGYDFFTVFDFGERDFDTIFEMGDAEQVLEHLRTAAPKDKSGMIAKAFSHHGWPL